MENQKPAQTQPPPAPNTAFDPSKIYPEAGSAAPPTFPQGTTPTTITQPAVKNHTLFGVPIIAAYMLFYASYYLWWSLKHPNFNLVIYGIDIVLALGLLARKEIARLILVIFTVIAIILQGMSLLALSTFAHSSPDFKLFLAISLIAQLASVIYLTRPSVKAYFS